MPLNLEDPATGFEGLVINDQEILAVKSPSKDFNGIVVSNRANLFPKTPIAFNGIIIESRPNEKFIQVLTSRGKPLIGANVFVDQSVDINAVTDSEGLIFGVFDVSGTLPVRIRSGNTYYDFTINAASQPLVTTFVFPLEYND